MKILWWFYKAISRKNQLIYRENRANIGLTQEEVAYMERNNHKLKAGVYCRVSTQLEIQEGLLWSSFFVTLLAKKYHYSIMQLPLLHAG